MVIFPRITLRVSIDADPSLLLPSWCDDERGRTGDEGEGAGNDIRVERSRTVVRQRARLPANYLAERFYLYLILI